MKKYTLILFLLIFFIIACGCEKTRIPQPIFPLEANSITVALEEVGLPWHISEEDSWYKGHTVYTLRNEEEEMVANVSSENIEGKKSLVVGFMYPGLQVQSNSAYLSEDEWEKVFKFISYLNGDFDTSTQMFKKFSNGKLHKDDRNPNVEKWDEKIGDVNCIARILKLESNSSQRYLIGIECYNLK